MRKLKLQVQMSVDGFIAGPNGEMDWLVWNWDDALKNYVGAITEPVDCMVLGRKLAEGFIPHWSAHPEMEGAAKINASQKVVFSRTLNPSDPQVKGWKNTLLAKGDLVDEIRKLKKQPGKDMMAYGGATFVSALIQQGLIDEYHLFINPAFLGKGMTIFNERKSRQDLTLVKASPFSCGIVVLHYEPTEK